MNSPQEKVFSLGPPPVDFGKVAPAARRKVGFTHSLTFGARLLYCLLVDFSLWTGKNMRPGVYRAANSFLAFKLGVDPKTIQNWKQELVKAGKIWLTERAMLNTYPMTIYHITEIVGEPSIQDSTESDDGLVPEEEDTRPANIRRARRSERDPVTGKWAKGSKTAKTPNTPVFEEKPDSVDRKGNNLPASTANSCRPQRQIVADDNGKSLPLSAANSCRPQRQAVAVADGKSLPLSAANSCRGDGKLDADKGETQIGDLSLSKRGGEAPPAEFDVEAAIKKWLPTLQGMFESKMEKLKVKLIEECRTAPTEPARLFAARKLNEVRNLLNPKHPDQLKPAPKAPVSDQVKPKLVPLSLENRRELMAKAKAAAQL